MGVTSRNHAMLHGYKMIEVLVHQNGFRRKSYAEIEEPGGCLTDRLFSIRSFKNKLDEEDLRKKHFMKTASNQDSNAPEQSDKQTEVFSFDSIWEKIPHISCYQFRLLILVGLMGFQGAFMAIYPVFAQYKPPVRCETIFDTKKEFR